MPQTATHMALVLVVWLGTLPPAAADEPDSRFGETWLRLDRFGPIDTPAAADAALAAGVRGLVMAGVTTSHNGNQTFDICLWRHSCSQGDAALVDAHPRSMGDIRAAANAAPWSGAIYAAEVESLTDVFRGSVERYDAASGPRG